MRQAVFSSANVPAAIAFVVLLICAIFADQQNRKVSDQLVRADVLAKVNIIRAKIEGNINGNLQLTQGLVSAIVTEPYMGQQRFASLAGNLFEQKSQLRNIAGAPDLVISLMYPLKGNEKAIGLDYRKNEAQRAAALRARDRHELVFAGPVDLAQGGRGFIGRIPVFVPTAGGGDRFWGIVSAVVDVDRLYAASGLTDPAIDIDVALTGKDALGGGGERFFGGDNVVAGNPVTAEVELPSGSWRISAIPKGGWPAAPKNERTLQALMALAGVLVVLPILVAGRLFGERQKNYAELRRLSGRLELALEASGIGVWEHDLATNELVWDERVNEIYGKPADAKPRGYDDWAGTIHPDDIERARRDFDQAAATKGLYSSQYRLVHHDGTIRHVRTRATFFQDSGDTPKMIGAEWDVTSDVLLNENLVRERQLSESKNAELEAASARIEHVALHDSLTGLPNRRYLDEMLAESGETGRTALLHLDLDRFKQINDTLGHAAGDAMLVHASKVIKANARPADFVARIGGDEFVVVGHGAGDDRLAELASRIIEEMRQPVNFQGHQCRFGVSIGIAANDGVDARQLLVNADLALYRAKSHGRNRYEFFNAELQSEIVRTKQIADEILGGLERNEFIAYYQPQFDARTLEIVGVEALSRWKHPRRGILAPAAYLKVAEELNVVALIDRTTLKQALENFERWSHLNIPRVSVNVSARRLEDRDLIKGLRKLAIKQGTVSFELVESIFLDENDDFVSWNIEQIKGLGIDIEIDDFGTGYASIVSLLKLQPRRLKIDRQLITPITGSTAQRRLVSSIIEIGKSLGIEVVAEGVETMDHARILKELGCDILQGYAFGAPMDAKTFKAFAQSRKWLQAG
ncbi:MAG: EAL domain-containing protein [Mesorhizobium sp.]|uniref:bifunctional diguanylate cyclase/phosphodiesterase n=8 Tax=Mesorhizobium TaxID=68287 RepID=UPI000F751F9F|nr:MULTISPECIES: EAL domain-containing protein [unclassified Mesorhizobium]AZO47974.1 EAL domain-containing protein [Mesorhizobium sp. M4B.F.Ca.ET.058.02.1.1]RVC80693.1 EAL domain-containing protein [Mesorhizobium sp. M4A.F.Ca.ET.022.05.2.1]RWD12234.1 MAG: EAL domain-containing protein [Mesorhizobium sp.]TIV83090.1 MAG: EAL domain-containing protein [Mesorhizobium sp.]TIW12361.1 MAG: EAL domain-containing protein [Mesorhizobium sp.]